MVRATSDGWAILRRGTVPWASVQSSAGLSRRPAIRGVSTQPGATALTLYCY
jgi:hypothetical protein